jgi:hypothetical protein
VGPEAESACSTSSSSFNKCIPLSRVLSHLKLCTCGQVSNLPFTIKIKTFQKCTIKNKEVEIMEGWCLSHLLKEEEEVEHADSASGPTKKIVRKTYF